MPEKFLPENFQPFGRKELEQLAEQRRQIEAGESTEPYDDIRKAEAKKWAWMVSKEIKLDHKDSNYKVQMSILEQLYFDGQIEYQLSQEGVAEKYAGYITQEDLESDRLKGYQLGTLTEQVAGIFLRDEFKQCHDDPETSALVLQMMNNFKNLPSYRKGEIDFKEKFANPDLITTRETQHGNIVVTGIYEVKSSIESLMKAEMEKSQFSNFVPHLKQVLAQMNKDRESFPEYDIAWLQGQKKIGLASNLRKVAILPKSKVDHPTKLFEWQVVTLPFSNDQLYALRDYIGEKGLVIGEHFELSIPALSEKKSVEKFNNTIEVDLSKIKEIVDDFDDIEFLSVLLFDRLPANEEQKKLLKDSGAFNTEEIIKDMVAYMRSHHTRDLLRLAEQHSDERFSAEIYRHFENPLSLAFTEMRRKIYKNMAINLSDAQRNVLISMPKKSLESLLYTLRIKDNSEMANVFRSKITEFFRPSVIQVERLAMQDEVVKAPLTEIADEKTEDNSRLAEVQPETEIDGTEQKFIERLELLRNKFNNKFFSEIGTLDQLQFNSMLLFGRIPRSEEERNILERFCQSEHLIGKIKRNMHKITGIQKNHIVKNEHIAVSVVGDSDYAIQLLLFRGSASNPSNWTKIGLSKTQAEIISKAVKYKLDFTELV
ncbi:hypothetical protein A3F08_03290 [Candidatus Berkelbacteria bacterium RIFCSPHIGHO2_12_FULL_36_9]|uniref:Uncharacterized protein n=1 Tax=Candidatus Berkelbacteria bacterium RIFCSPHIGHO2_12_FULL_36_9 TaxID=1797469 RepID=A0A1F5EK02_9BACT|nr:MAG: hypothetical protein A3F08_03290 [Candidatus Berkelbacteria bacterium RIFCSPHIGHO2_12_FULL_36_9]